MAKRPLTEADKIAQARHHLLLARVIARDLAADAFILAENQEGQEHTDTAHRYRLLKLIGEQIDINRALFVELPGVQWDGRSEKKARKPKCRPSSKRRTDRQK